MTLEKVCKIISGNSIPAKKKEEYYTDVKGMPYVATKDVGFDGAINYENGIFIPDEYLSGFKISPAFATLVCAEGGSAGRKIAFSTEECCLVNKLFSLQPNENIIPKFIYYYTLGTEFQSQFKEAMHGLIGGVSMSKIKDFYISIPPLAEQQRIVAKLDAAFAEIDRVVENTRANVKSLDGYFEKFLDELLLSATNDFELKPIKDFGKAKGGKRLPKGAKFSESKTKHPYLRIVDFCDSGDIDETDLKYIDEEVFSEISRYTITCEDVYIAIVGATIGKTGIVQASLSGANLTENAAKIELTEECSSEYLYYCSRAKFFKEQVVKQSRAAAQPKLALERLEKIEVPITDISHQTSLVKKFKKAYHEVECLRELYLQKISSLNALKISLLSSLNSRADAP
jgi:type I restriction enzyme S subunit